MSTDHTAELVNALKDIKHSLAAQTEHLKTNSLLLQALLELNQREAEKRAAAEQPGNKDAAKPPDVEDEAYQNGGILELLGKTSLGPFGAAPPNFVPQWELTGKSKNQDIKWYHIDDHKFTTSQPLPCPPKAKMHQSWQKHLYVPYSHSMTRRMHRLVKNDDNAERTGLGLHADAIIDVLNNLYSVPADARLPLGFEPLSLRRMKSTNELDEYLVKATQFLDNLHHASGTFIIWDYDAFGNHFCYYPSDLKWGDRDKLFDLFPVTSESLQWHRYNEHQRVDRYYKLIPHDIYMEFFNLLTTRNHWQATDWAACGQKRLRVAAHLSSKDVLGDNELQSTRYVLAADDNHNEEKNRSWSKQEREENETTTNLTPSFRPWYRIIDVNGLECIDGPDVAHTFVHFLFSTYSPAMEYSFEDTGMTLEGHLLKAVSQHLKADPLWGTAVATEGQWATFHIAWYCASPKPYKSSWGYGPLYVEEGSFLSRQSFSVTIYCSNYESSSSGCYGDYWTMLVLPPPQLYTLPGQTGVPFWNSSVCIRSGVLDFIDHALSQAATDWAELDPYFDHLDAKRELIFDPKQHDSLLFDDRHFSRSRLYFWAINSLGRFIQDINSTIERWESFWEENEEAIRKSEEYLVVMQAIAKDCKEELRIGDKSVDDLHTSILARVESLKNTRKSFESRRQKIIEYRDGLFNASSVIETREATRLSQNVKLLTFVSIFYLPLGFCMSMWSINEDFNPNNLIAVTICIGLATYLVVANLETTVYTIRCGLLLLFEAPRQRLVRKMTEERGTRWSFLGQELSRVQPSREDAKPSEWLIVGYWLMTIYRSFKSFRGTEQEAQQGGAGEDERPPEPRQYTDQELLLREWNYEYAESYEGSERRYMRLLDRLMARSIGIPPLQRDLNRVTVSDSDSAVSSGSDQDMDAGEVQQQVGNTSTSNIKKGMRTRAKLWLAKRKKGETEGSNV